MNLGPRFPRRRRSEGGARTVRWATERAACRGVKKERKRDAHARPRYAQAPLRHSRTTLAAYATHKHTPPASAGGCNAHATKHSRGHLVDRRARVNDGLATTHPHAHAHGQSNQHGTIRVFRLQPSRGTLPREHSLGCGSGGHAAAFVAQAAALHVHPFDRPRPYRHIQLAVLASGHLFVHVQPVDRQHLRRIKSSHSRRKGVEMLELGNHRARCP